MKEKKMYLLALHLNSQNPIFGFENKKKREEMIDIIKHCGVPFCISETQI